METNWWSRIWLWTCWFVDTWEELLYSACHRSKHCFLWSTNHHLQGLNLDRLIMLRTASWQMALETGGLPLEVSLNTHILYKNGHKKYHAIITVLMFCDLSMLLGRITLFFSPNKYQLNLPCEGGPCIVKVITPGWKIKMQVIEVIQVADDGRGHLGLHPHTGCIEPIPATNRQWPFRITSLPPCFSWNALIKI